MSTLKPVIIESQEKRAPDDIVEIVKACYHSVAVDGQFDVDNLTLADDFKFIAGMVEVNKNDFIEIITRLYRAIPDLKHVLTNIQIRGDTVQLTHQAVGTFTKDWDGTDFGLPRITATNTPVQMGPIKWEITVRKGNITRWHDVTMPSADSGLRGFFKALGSEMPAHKPRK